MDKKESLVISEKKINSLKRISDQFGVAETVRQLQYMMTKVTEKEISSDTVNAACNCVSNLNLTIKTAISAAKFLADQKDNE